MNKAGTRNIETTRLLLRRFRIDDAEDMYNNWANDPEVTRFLTWFPHENVDVTRGLIEEWISQYDNGDYFNWVMELKETGKIIGNISVVRVRELLHVQGLLGARAHARGAEGCDGLSFRRGGDESCCCHT